MTAPELKYDFLLKKDRVQSLSTHYFNDAEIDWFLNEAQLVFLKQRLGVNNSRRASYEAIQKRIDDLSNLHIKFPVQPPLPLIAHGNIYELDLSSLSKPYFQFLRASVTVKENGCTTDVPLKFTQTDDMSEVLKDPFNNASVDAIPFNFGRATLGENSSIYLYPATQVPLYIQVEYITTPKRISQGTYAYLDNTIHPETTSQLSPNVHSELVDIAVQLAQMALDQNAKEKLLLNE